MPAAHSEVGLIVESALNRDNLQDLLETARRVRASSPSWAPGSRVPSDFLNGATFFASWRAVQAPERPFRRGLPGASTRRRPRISRIALGALAFEDAIRRTFGADDISGRLSDAAVRSLPALATGPVLTTNFDRVLETVFKEAGQPFEESVWGAQPSRIAQALHVNVPLLWKLHGDAKAENDRVLTNSHTPSTTATAIPRSSTG